MEKFDRRALYPEAGVRAVWLLYKRGKWDLLSDFGVERANAQGAFQKFEADNAPITRRLSRAQCRKLEKLVPGVKEAAKELRLAYALKYYDEDKRKKEK